MQDRIPVLPLPHEIVQMIARMMTHESFPILRLVCRSFNDAMIPLTFPQAVISYSSRKPDDFVDQLRTLATNIHPAPHFAEILTIRNTRFVTEFARNDAVEVDDESRELDPTMARARLVEQYLPLAIAAFKKVSKIIWFSSEHLHNSLIEAIGLGMAQLSSLTALDVHVVGGRPPESKSQLEQELISNSSDRLIHLCVTLHDLGMFGPSALDPLLALSPPLNITHLVLKGFFVKMENTVSRHLRSLVSLTITNVASAHERLSRTFKQNFSAETSFMNDMWIYLAQEKIQLREIELEEPTDSFIQYLKSYNGLKKLTIKRAISYSVEMSNDFASAFYEALPKHVGLEELDISPFYESRWCYGMHNIDVFSCLTNLRLLTIAIISDSSEIVTINGGDSQPIHSTWQLQCGYYLSTPVHSLMKTVHVLPKFEVLTIQHASLSLNREQRRLGSQRWTSNVEFRMQVDDQVTSFGPLDPTKYTFKVVF
ncbi:hypothetical protein BDQ17DRAFT_1410152 [Cyathus striatus]|nr:hypothetical protein BDQ17DRAFT_1410152 [Cyathus striatus]